MNMLVVVVALLVALLICIIVICKLMDMVETKDDEAEDLLQENNELRIKIGELMCAENLRKEIGRW